MTALNSVCDLSRENEVAVLTINSPPVNALSHDVREGLYHGVSTAIADDDVVSIVIICQGRTFIAGADLREGEAQRRPPWLRDIRGVIDNSPKPIVAAVHGTALGGGLELSFMCHYRIAVPSARCGLPEVNIGILPGAGGTQTLPRLTGAEKALEIMTSGRHVGADEALALGIYDELAPEGRLKEHAIAFAGRIAGVRPIPRVRDLTAKLDADRKRPELFEDFRQQNLHRFRNMAAPEEIIRCVEAALSLPFDDGLQRETEGITRLKEGPQSAAMRYAFFAEREAAKIPGVADDTPTRPVRSVGIIGVNARGRDIAASLASRGISVVLVGCDELMSGTADVNTLSGVDFVFEVASGQLDVKTDILSRLDRICKPGAIFATTAAGLNVNDLMTKRSQDCLGLHVSSREAGGRLVEVACTNRTAKDVVATSMKLARAIGKIPVLTVADAASAGDRMWRRLQQEAVLLVRDGATPSDIDRVLYDFGFPAGPFAGRDIAALETAANESTSRKVPDEEILERCLYAAVNEGVQIIAEGKAIRGSDLDVIWRCGYGFPIYRGGLMYYGDQIGAAGLLAKLKQFEAAHGERFKPAPLLAQLVAQGGRLATMRAPRNIF